MSSESGLSQVKTKRDNRLKEICPGKFRFSPRYELHVYRGSESWEPTAARIVGNLTAAQ